MTTTRGNGSIRSSEVASQALGTPLARAGVVIVVASIVGVQFIDVTLGSVGGFTLSAQKLAMAAALPLGVLLIGRLSLPREIVWPAITLSVTFAAASILGDSPNSALPSTLVSLLFSIAAMAALYTALEIGRAHV